METIRKGRIDIDTRPCPTVSMRFYKTASDDPFNAPVGGLFESVIGSEKGSQTRMTMGNGDRTTPSIPVASFQTMYSSVSTLLVLSTTTGKATPRPTLAIGEIFAIVLGSLIALVLLIVLLIRCLGGLRHRKRRTKKENAPLRHVMRSPAISEDAWEVGLDRLQETSRRNWAHKKAAAQYMDFLGKPETNIKVMREQDSLERWVLRGLFEEESRVHGGEGGKKLPTIPNGKA